MRNPYPEFVWFFGIVEDTSSDPLRLGRLRVRAVGFHSSSIATTDLPLAFVLDGGAARITKGQMVLGFFLDGEEAQQPCILGTLGGAVTGSNFVDILRGAGRKSVSEAPDTAGVPDAETDEEPISRVVASENKTVRVLEMQANATRNRPISSRLKQVLETAAIKADLFVVVVSGGQPAFPGGPRVGSTRHDNGNAADFDLYYPDPANPKQRGTQQVFSSNAAGLEKIKEFLREARAVGAKGIGHGPGYMSPGRTHLDVVKANVWGAGGTILNAPSWLKNL